MSNETRLRRHQMFTTEVERQAASRYNLCRLCCVDIAKQQMLPLTDNVSYVGVGVGLWDLISKLAS